MLILLVVGGEDEEGAVKADVLGLSSREKS
jgi:hypothetical protein